MRIEIESFLTEQKVKNALQKIFGNNWIGGQIVLPNSRRKFDMAFRFTNTIVLVEYDGD